jgi:phospholipid/cholesterol/gamma-HCH transport system substrate-binding protein
MRRDLINFRYASEATGLIVLVALVLFAAAVIQAGVLRDWFRPSVTLRVILPEEGVGGLSRGAPVDILGTRAGEVTSIVIDPGQQMHAEVRLQENMRVYVRRDSEAVIRKRFGVAGDSYLDITRGTGQPLDWTYAVISAGLERPPTENIGAMLDEVKQRVLPIIDETHRTVRLLASTMDRLERGEGTVGRLLADDSLIRDLEATAANAQASTEGVPAILRRVEASLAEVQTITRNLAPATAQMPQIARNMEETSRNLPMVVLQARATTAELQQLVVQLQRHWLIGRDPEGTTTRLPSTAVRP